MEFICSGTNLDPSFPSWILDNAEERWQQACFPFIIVIDYKE